MAYFPQIFLIIFSTSIFQATKQKLQGKALISPQLFPSQQWTKHNIHDILHIVNMTPNSLHNHLVSCYDFP